MLKAFRSEWIFFAFTAVFSLFLFRTHEEAILCGLLYSALLGFRISPLAKARDLFPLGMLFLFLIVLTQIPPRQFTTSLLYTVRSLILFRTLVLELNAIQTAKSPSSKSALPWIIGLMVSLFASAVLLYSTFKPVSEGVLSAEHYLLAAPLMILGTLYTPLMIPGLALGLLSLYLPLQWISVSIFSLAVAAYGVSRTQSRVRLPTSLS